MEYLDIKYNTNEKPITSYPKKFAEYNINRFLLKGKKVLEIGCGRGDVSNGFYKLGVDLHAVDIDDYSKKFLDSDIKFEKCNLEKENLPFKNNTFDLVYSKSVLEHIVNPENFFKEIKRVLKKDGLIVIYTPDWETQYKNFFDDVTHVKPYTTESLKQIHLKYEFRFLSAEKFYQLPITWKFPFIKFLCNFLSMFTPIRSKIKFLRFSKELMILSVAQKK